MVPRESIIPRTAPRDAADVTPKMSGVANGFEKSAWKAIPAAVSPPPTMRAVRTLGSLIFIIKDSIRGSTCPPPIKFLKNKIISDILISILPMERPIRPQARGKKIKIK